ncbi:NUDIX hydrolase [Sporosarcina sp. YIM B06819]|uniref:NUDIX hydrolase n=1 Tax=Sporosarcina sp. YIM B06819 TaxID=3081769 RepID=UPI00298C6CCC|nr:NUDIX hydrolase [Sporosarcina sp. YIM B06819]
MDVVFQTAQGVFNFRVAGIWIENGHVLVHRDVNESNWSLPGGRVAIAEDSQSSLTREFREELGIDVQVDRMALVIENFFEHGGKNYHEIGFYYVVTADSNFASIQEKPFHGIEGERLIFKWMPLEKLDTVELYPECLRTYLQELQSNVQHLVVK